MEETKRAVKIIREYCETIQAEAKAGYAGYANAEVICRHMKKVEEKIQEEAGCLDEEGEEA